MTEKELEVLKLRGEQGSDLSPGDPICRAAYLEIIRLQEREDIPKEKIDNKEEFYEYKFV